MDCPSFIISCFHVFFVVHKIFFQEFYHHHSNVIDFLLVDEEANVESKFFDSFD